MVNEHIHIPCPECGVTNRVPLVKTDKRAKCGKCHAPLPSVVDAVPIIVTEATFQDEVLNSDLPVLVDFWAPWCAPCRALAPSLESMAKEFVGRLKVVKVNSDENMGLSQQYQVRSIPTLIIFEGGALKQQISGALPIQQLRVWIKRTMGWL